MAANLKDIAAAAGVSVTTVSYVLNNKGRISDATRERVKAAIKELSYRRRGRATGNLAMIFSGNVPPFIPAIYEAVAEYGFALHQVRCDDEAETAPSFDAQLRMDGVLVYGGVWKRRFLEELARDFPVVLLGASLPTMRADSVWIDNAGAFYAATDYLLARGHRAIGLVNGPATSSTSAEKQVGFERALRHYGREATGVVVEAASYEIVSAREAAAELLERIPRVTAIVSAESSLTFGVMDVLKAAGRSVPRDVSVISFRDEPRLRALPVAMIAVPFAELARQAVSTLVQRINQPGRPGHRVLIQPSLLQTEKIASPA